MTSRLVLVLVEEHPLTRALVAPRGRATIGRARCALTLFDPAASRLHAALEVRDSRAVIEDLGSRNGTWVNGERVTRRRALTPGDAIRLGNTRWRVTTSTEGWT